MFYLLTRPDCKWCDKAKELLIEKGEGYQAFSYNEHPMLLKVMVKAGFKTVPQIWKDNDHIGGYAELVEWFEKDA